MEDCLALLSGGPPNNPVDVSSSSMTTWLIAPESGQLFDGESECNVSIEQSCEQYRKHTTRSLLIVGQILRWGMLQTGRRNLATQPACEPVPCVSTHRMA